MNFTVILAATCVFVLVAANSIKAVPWLWYGLACAVDIVYAYGIVYSLLCKAVNSVISAENSVD